MPSDLLREGARRAIHRAEKRVLIEGADDAVLSPVRSKCTRTGAHTANSLTGVKAMSRAGHRGGESHGQASIRRPAITCRAAT